MEILDWSPEDTQNARLANAAQLPEEPQPDYIEEPGATPTFSQSMEAYLQENLFVAALDAAFRKDDAGDFIPEPEFNPYTYYYENKDQYGDLQPYMQQGLFDNVVSKEHFDARAEQVLKELDNKEVMAASSLGQTLAGMGLMAADPTAAIPFLGWLSKGTVLARAGKSAAYAAGITAMEEAGLHQFQQTRSVDESLLNVGISAPIGGALGIFAGAAVKANRLHPDHPENPFKVENDIPVGYWHPGESVSEASKRAEKTAQADLVNDSVGAASADVLTDLETGKRGWLGEYLEKGAKAFSFSKLGPIATRTFRLTGKKARQAYAKLMDVGGKMTTKDVEGHSVGLTAEDIREQIVRTYEDLDQSHVDELYKLRTEMGESKSRLVQSLKSDVNSAASFLTGDSGKKVFNTIEDHEFEDLTMKALLGVDQEALLKEASKFGPNADKVVAAAQRQAERIHKANEEMEQRMVDAGLISEKDRLGRDYGFAQLWDGQQISRNPEAFKEFLYRVFKKEPDEEWLAESYGMSLEDFKRLGQSDNPEDIVKKNQILEEWLGDEHSQKLELAQDAAKAAERRAKYLKRNLTDVLRGLKGVEKDIQKADLRHARVAVEKRLTERDTMRSRLEKLKAEEQELMLAAQGARTKTLERYLSDSPTAERLRHEPPASGEVGRIQGRLHEIARQRRLVERRLAKLEPKLEKLQKQLAEAETAAYEARELRKAFRQLARELKEDTRKAASKAKSTARKASKAAKRPAMYEVVDGIVHRMRNGQAYSLGFLDEAHLAASGRTKRRMIRLSKEERLEALQKGWQRSDIYQVMRRSATDIGGRIGMRRTIGEDLQGVVTDSKLYKEIQDEYDALKARTKDPKVQAYLDAELRQVAEDLTTLRDRLVGVAGIPSDPNSVFTWAGRQFRAANFVKYGAGFLMSSLVDPATTALTVGFKNVFNPKYINRVRSIVKDTSKDTIAKWLVAAERVQYASRSAKVTNLEDFAVTAGIGVPGTTKHNITSKMERALRALSDRVNVISGLHWWNSRLKIFASVVQQDKLIRMAQTGEYDRLLAAARKGDKEAQATIGNLSTLLIDEDAMRILKKQLEKYPPIEEDGVYSLGIDRWLDGTEEGAEAFELIASSLRRAADRSVPTPGIGDTPVLMDDQTAKLIMQFQTFGYVTVTRMIGPLGQRIRTLKDMEAVLSAGMALALGSVVVMGKDISNYGQIKDRSVGNWVYDVLDRAGYFAWATPFLGMFRQISGIGGPPSRFANVNAWGRILGPSFGLGADITGAAGAIIQAPISEDVSVQDVGKKLERLLPFQFYWRIFKQLAD